MNCRWPGNSFTNWADPDGCSRWMRCTVKKTLETVLATGNHLLVQVKANQPTLFEHLTGTYPAQPAQDRHHTHEIGRHHRIERRLTRTWPLPLGTGPEAWHNQFRTLVEIQRHTEVFDTRQKDGVLRQETAHYVSTAALSAADAAQAVRAHWSIENRLHDVRDVTLGEDASRIRRNLGLFALLRSFALNLLRFNGVSNISYTTMPLTLIDCSPIRASSIEQPWLLNRVQ